METDVEDSGNARNIIKGKSKEWKEKELNENVNDINKKKIKK